MTATTKRQRPLFALGHIVATPGAIRKIREHHLRGTSPGAELITRHVCGDWGELDAEDREANDRAVHYGERILSSYILPDGDKIWIITERDRSVTTLLLPEEY
jgi:hypothetical protein